MAGSFNQGRDSIEELVYEGEAVNLDNYGHLCQDGETTIYSTGHSSSPHEWVASPEALDPSKDVYEQLRELL